MTMRNIRLRSASFGLLASLFCGAATLFGSFWVLSAASQDATVINQSAMAAMAAMAAMPAMPAMAASEGRPITPAGELITDATTRLPAVAPLTVDFVRSPDKSGQDGKGRYLIAVNSGFGLQFNAGTNQGQQSL